jgi:hypothetical protein
MSGAQDLLLGNFSTAAAGFQIERSLRFNSADSAYLDRTPASASNQKTWTWSGWVKRGALGRAQYIFGATQDSYNVLWTLLLFDSADKLSIEDYQTSAFRLRLTTTQVFRDPSAWYHIVVAIDTTQATDTNRVKLYINGNQITAFGTSTYPTQNIDTYVDSANPHTLSSNVSTTTVGLSGYLADINFIDGQALTPSSFGETDADTGVWKPKAYSGSYGTNGFYLKFADNSGTTSTTLGKDSSGNSNNWTPNNFSVTAGAGNDSLVDSPTQYGTDTGAGGEVRGNYCTLNSASPLASATANGNLQLNYNTTNCVPGTIGVTTGKWYWEGLLTTQTDSQQYFGVANSSFNLALTVGEDANSWGMTVQSNSSNGKAQHNNVQSSSYATFGNGDICMVAYDMATGKIWFGRNGTWFNSGAPASGTGEIYSNLSGTIVPMLCNDINSGGVLQVNFGQRPFAYTAPSGYKALCTTNLPTPTIGATATTRADDYFNTVLYTGTGSSLSVTGVGFQPDFVWIKERAGAADHGLYDAVRGVQKQLESNNLDAETTETTGLTAFGTDGFTVGALAQLNTNTDTYVAWNWNAGGSNATNTSGTITSTVRANTTAGFSIVSYTGSSASTVGHGLGVAPAMIIAKQRNNVEHWVVYHQSTGKDAVLLFTTGAVISSANYWGSGGVTSTVFGTGGAGAGNAQNSIIAYCFAPVAGYSAFGSYTGNGSSDGPFIYTGFRPKFVMIKCSSASSTDWAIYDATRSTYNVVGNVLVPNLSDAEFTGITGPDIVSNGFKLRDTNSSRNSNGATYIYASFASNPFKYSLGA